MEPAASKLIDMFLKALEQPNRHGNYPLGCCLRGWRNTEDIVWKMIHLAPIAVSAPDEHGDYPLHMAIPQEYSDNVLLKMIELCPQAIKLPNRAGHYVLYYAIFGSYIRSSTVILTLIKQFPKAVKVLGLKQFPWQYDDSNERFYPAQVALRMCNTDKQYKSVVLKLLKLCPKICTLLSFKEINAMDDDIQKMCFYYKKQMESFKKKKRKESDYHRRL